MTIRRMALLSPRLITRLTMVGLNTIIGGPADTVVTKWIEMRANEYLTAYCESEDFKRISIDNIEPTAQVPSDY